MASLSDTDGDDGLTIVLSPVQLAAVMQGRSISANETSGGRFLSRLFGGLQMIGGAIELVGAAGLFLAPEPTALTKAGGAVLGANGVDNTATGAFELWTGRSYSTLTERAARAAARSLGCDPDTAETVGIVVDIAVPVVAAAGLGAARALAVREGMIDLKAEEAAGGHTIARHVGKDEAFLRNRLATEPKIPAAGTFRSLPEAEKFVSRAISANASQIQSWASTAKPGAILPLPIYDAGQIVGVTIPRLTGTLKSVSKVQVVLRKTVVGQKVYFVLTAYPSHL
ncbi:hypothetical protein GCM10011611_28000 [Aliidongia dinghuensis]|uniref:Bacterial CdiA-CT RNAse A domain-containing protein n=1 Tax=Aliidongia dinghuensis TaxID=1867774 RepID=A0A8J2YTP4_9PROT|nr:RNase A-like domain-containing protein [Aliidongia dinghuensis]GGF20387.1 hypothetical protein GCM10011611_28000 [Aliidongia dinghuensis]